MVDFGASSEHRILKESAASFIKKEHSFNRLRELKKDHLGYSREMWKKMAELGWLGVLYPEKYGGLGLSFSYAAVLLEEFGAGLLPEPFISSVLLGGNSVLRAGTESQKIDILKRIVSGDLMVTVAYLEDNGRYDVNFCTTTAVQTKDKFMVSGRKIFVMDGCSADKFIISARTSGDVSDTNGITLFIIPRKSEGLTITPLKTMDGRNSCIVELKEVIVSSESILGEPDKGYPILCDVIDEAAVGLCCEMIGGMRTVMDMTLNYLCQREQFGRPIGSFQALQHKAADMFISKELATSATYYAVASIESNTGEKAASASLAKAKCSVVYTEMCKMSVQMFGAIGFSNEADIGLFLKRSKVAETLFGDAEYHMKRYLNLQEY
ncbi:MAG TPA: acyl-CoA dehydrogenase [Deltaproteobacteria bacterium]|nr:acyl-CoA dehydrogenase [Deltaproteobacteria bacterium]